MNEINETHWESRHWGECMDRIINGDNTEVLAQMPDCCVDLVVTSPPYDDMRTYGSGQHDWTFAHFTKLARQLTRTLKPGGVIVWVVGDQTIDGSETCSSFKQAMHFCWLGLNLHDTMIYEKQSGNPPQRRYWQNFEYMFVLTKGKPKTFNGLRDKPNAYVLNRADEHGERGKFGLRSNIWRYPVGGKNIGDPIAHKHPAPFPEALAADHIRTWSNPGDLVVDPFVGSGTTAAVARKLERHFIGIEIESDYVQLARKRLSGWLFAGAST